MLTDETTKITHRSIQLLGLSQEHAKIYIALLDLGNSSASKIAKRSGVPRTTAYDQLEDLIDVGLVSKAKSESRYEYSPAAPQTLNRMIKERVDIVQENSYSLERSLFELEALYSSKSATLPRVRFFQGERGLKTALYDSLSANELLTTCQGSAYRQSGLKNEPKYLMDFIAECERRNLKSREILMDTPSVREYAKKYKEDSHTQILIIPNSNSNLIGHVDKHLYEGKIAYISHDSLVAVIIEDQSLYDHEKMLFESLWDHYSKI